MFNLIQKYVDQYSLSDIHLRSDSPVAIRVDGEIMTFKEEVVSSEAIDNFIDQSLNDTQKEQFKKYKNIDLSLEHNNTRYRTNFYKTTKGNAIVMRVINSEVLPLSALDVPFIFSEITKEDNGLVLITGPTGSGKSTTLSSMIDLINETRNANIITIEDPIEFIHKDKRSIISQREIGTDAYSFNSALKAALREDPDVILVGELRDLETVQLALTAAETGHLVFATLHTSGAPNTINRIIDVFPPAQQDQVRSQLAQSLKLVATQKLFKKANGQGRVAAVEVMVCTPAVQNLIRDDKIHQILNVMQTAKADGMITMEKSIEQLRNTGKINWE